MRAVALIPALALVVGFAPQETPVAAQVKLKDAAPGAKAPNVGDEVAVLDTSMGRIVLRFFPDKAPGHVKNFTDLAKKEFYNGTAFHRTIKGFMIQGGDPKTKDPALKGEWGTGDPGYKIDAEFNDISHTRGILSMARGQDQNSAGSQFFIVLRDSKFLDNQYTVFGQVIEGMKVVDKIAEAPVATNARGEGSDPITPVVINSVKIETWPLSVPTTSGR
jgi:cyclophilin family peptidyl-prolyl cis-trans isomerase